MNFENSTDILFVHKMNKKMESQVIGRAQRIGRKSVLNVIYLEYENESEYIINRKELNIEININNDFDDYYKDNELEQFYENKKYSYLLDNIKEIDFSNISGNDITYQDQENDQSSTIINIPDLLGDPIDINLDQLIASLV